MSLLNRYLVKRNLFLLGMLLLAGLGIYLLTDAFDRMDRLLDSGLTFTTIIKFFALKIPVIISQILPATFLLSLVVQFCLMAKNREMTALQAGGISPFTFLSFVVCYGILWSLLQLGFSQIIGVDCERAAQQIWQEEVQKNSPDRAIKGIWFTENSYVVHLNVLYPNSGHGVGLNAYLLSPDGLGIEKIITADSFSIFEDSAHKPGSTKNFQDEPSISNELSNPAPMVNNNQAQTSVDNRKRKRQWFAYDGNIVDTKTFSYETFEFLPLPIKQNMQLYIEARRYGSSGEYLSMTALHHSIRMLELSGSNVEDMRTKFHARISYAASLLVMAVLSLAITQGTTNLYVASSLSLVATFTFYAAFTFCNTLGAGGYMPPFLAAWLSDILFLVIGLAFILRKALDNYKIKAPSGSLTSIFVK